MVCLWSASGRRLKPGATDISEGGVLSFSESTVRYRKLKASAVLTGSFQSAYIHIITQGEVKAVIYECYIGNHCVVVSVENAGANSCFFYRFARQGHFPWEIVSKHCSADEFIVHS